MPVRRVTGGYQWGTRGRVYPTRSQAAAQGRAVYAAGYKKESDMGMGRGRGRGKKPPKR